MTTTLDKLLKRQVTVDGLDYTLAVDPDGMRLTSKGKRTPQVDLRWSDMLSGEAAMAMALNASLSKMSKPATTQENNVSVDRTKKAVRKKLSRKV